MINIGVLELQGNYALHHKIFSDLGISSKGIKSAKDLDNVDGLVIPGGESTTISLLLDSFDLRKPIKNYAKENPIMGTCAGLIMMSKSIKGDKKVTPLGILDIIVDRNAYGRQIMSCKEPVSFRLNNQKIEINATLIRAPKIISISDAVNVLAMIDSSPAVVMQGRHLGLSFHPEQKVLFQFHK